MPPPGFSFCAAAIIAFCCVEYGVHSFVRGSWCEYDGCLAGSPGWPITSRVFPEDMLTWRMPCSGGRLPHLSLFAS